MTEPTHVTRPSPSVTVIGEALIDLVQLDLPGDYRARPGGSPFNVAIGLARLAHHTALPRKLSRTPRSGWSLFVSSGLRTDNPGPTDRPAPSHG